MFLDVFSGFWAKNTKLHNKRLSKINNIIYAWPLSSAISIASTFGATIPSCTYQTVINFCFFVPRINAVSLWNDFHLCKLEMERYATDLTLSFGFCFLFPFVVILQFSSSQDNSVGSVLDGYLKGAGFKSRCLQLNFQFEKHCRRDSKQYAIKYGCVASNLNDSI